MKRTTACICWQVAVRFVVNRYCFLYGHEANMEHIKYRAKGGQPATYYVACGPAKPNTFVFSPLAEGRWISWYAAALSYNGFLRWTYNAWPEDLISNAHYDPWAARYL